VIFFYSTLGYGTYNPAPSGAASGSLYLFPYGRFETNTVIAENKNT
jgi:hypothetical protein